MSYLKAICLVLLVVWTTRCARGLWRTSEIDRLAVAWLVAGWLAFVGILASVWLD
jgi:hypothetical protein